MIQTEALVVSTSVPERMTAPVHLSADGQWTLIPWLLFMELSSGLWLLSSDSQGELKCQHCSTVASGTVVSALESEWISWLPNRSHALIEWKQYFVYLHIIRWDGSGRLIKFYFMILASLLWKLDHQDKMPHSIFVMMLLLLLALPKFFSRLCNCTTTT